MRSKTPEISRADFASARRSQLLSFAGAALPLIVAIAIWSNLTDPGESKSIRAAESHDEIISLHPAAWGSDHVGKELPEYITGDECLFCHRDIGKTWPRNRHQLTLRAVEPISPEIQTLKDDRSLAEVAGEVEFLLGHKLRKKFLKRGKEFGSLSILSTELEPARKKNAPGRLIHAGQARWEEKTFGARCAGCHTTGVDSRTHAFSAISLDCFVCHGDATLDHSKDISKMILAKARRDEPRVVVSICGQCHLRSGRSQSTGLPYPNNFVAGDNLLRDFRVDLSDAAIARLNPADRHVAENVRDGAVRGKESVTCLSCHDIHRQSSRKHRNVAEGSICLNCHNAEGPKSKRPAYKVTSDLCGY